MTFDPASIGPEAQGYYTHIGEEFGSEDVLSQLDLSILGADKYAPKLSFYGWPASQTQKMKDVRELLAAALVARGAAKADRKTNNAALHDAMRAGKNAKRAARTALFTARNELFEQSKLDLVNQIDSLLATTPGVGHDAKLLSKQLGNLGELLANDQVAPILGDGATSLQTRVTTAATALDVAMASKGRPRGTPEATQHVNLLDGVGAVLVRTLRKAGRAAARAEGQPDIANAFELNALYGRSRHTQADPTQANPTS